MRSVSFLSLLAALSVLFLFSHLGFSKPVLDPTASMATVGGRRDVPRENSVETEELARFAVKEHNQKANALLEFGRLLKVQEQVVAGTVYYLTLTATEGGKEKTYEAKVWVKPWMKFKELQEFKQVGDGSTPSNASA